MPESSTLTIRIEEELKSRLEAAATAADQTVTEYVVRSVKQRMAVACSTCGHDGAAVVAQAPGMTKAFSDWMLGLQGSRFVTIATMGPDGSRVYRGGTSPNDLHDSYIDLSISAGDYVLVYPIARSMVHMWSGDDREAKNLHARLMAAGHVDGNRVLVHGLAQQIRQDARQEGRLRRTR